MLRLAGYFAGSGRHQRDLPGHPTSSSFSLECFTLTNDDQDDEQDAPAGPGVVVGLGVGGGGAVVVQMWLDLIDTCVREAGLLVLCAGCMGVWELI